MHVDTEAVQQLYEEHVIREHKGSFELLKVRSFFAPTDILLMLIVGIIDGVSNCFYKDVPNNRDLEINLTTPNLPADMK